MYRRDGLMPAAVGFLQHGVVITARGDGGPTLVVAPSFAPASRTPPRCVHSGEGAVMSQQQEDSLPM